MLCPPQTAHGPRAPPGELGVPSTVSLELELFFLVATVGTVVGGMTPHRVTPYVLRVLALPRLERS